GRPRPIPHGQSIRIGAKMPAFDPGRLLRDEELQRAFRKYSTRRKRIYLMAHFDHPRELTGAAIEGLDCYLRNGVICVNQCPLIKGVNDNAEVLSTLYRRLSYVGCPPYYLFQGRPTAGNEPYELPIVRGWEIFTEALRRGSGLARRARFVMSHETGKVEIQAVDERHIYLRYHQAKNEAMSGKFMVYHRDDEAFWLDQLEPVEGFGSPNFEAPSPFDLADGPE
ncbi:MAG: KamA family radical SAM protein, partial [bacterium]|nr:KamA family radical SAM protein [bacterium]